MKVIPEICCMHKFDLDLHFYFNQNLCGDYTQEEGWQMAYTWLVTRVTQQVIHVEQELPTLPEHLSSPMVLVRFALLDL